MKIRSGEELAKALNERVASKTTDKTIAVMAGMSDIPWELVKMFSLRWDVVDDDDVIVPIINIVMHNAMNKGEDVKVETDGEDVKSEIRYEGR